MRKKCRREPPVPLEGPPDVTLSPLRQLIQQADITHLRPCESPSQQDRTKNRFPSLQDLHPFLPDRRRLPSSRPPLLLRAPTVATHESRPMCITLASAGRRRVLKREIAFGWDSQKNQRRRRGMPPFSSLLSLLSLLSLGRISQNVVLPGKPTESSRQQNRGRLKPCFGSAWGEVPDRRARKGVSAQWWSPKISSEKNGDDGTISPPQMRIRGPPPFNGCTRHENCTARQGKKFFLTMEIQREIQRKQDR